MLALLSRCLYDLVYIVPSMDVRKGLPDYVSGCVYDNQKINEFFC